MDSLALHRFAAYRRSMSAIESNWKNTLIAFGIAILAAVTITTLLNVMIVPTPLPLRPDSLELTVKRFCDPTGSPAYAMTYDQMLTCRDLAAQESMAASTASLVRLGWLSLFAGLAGSGFVIWTILVARRSMDLTRKTLEHQQVATRVQLRPRLRREALICRPLPTGGAQVSIAITNTGGSAADGFRQGHSVLVIPKGDGSCRVDLSKFRLEKRTFSLSAGADAKLERFFSQDEMDQFETGDVAVQIVILAIYNDELGGKYKFSSGVEYSGAGLSFSRGITGIVHTEPALAGRRY